MKVCEKGPWMPTLPNTSMSAPSSASNTVKIDHETLAARATQMVEILSGENKSLRRELDKMYEKVAKLQKFEQDIMRVQADHEMLVETSRKREQLETVYKWKLENEIKRLQSHNGQLMAKLEHLHAHYTNKESVTAQQKVETGELHSELHKRGAMIAELTAQRQECDMSYVRMEEEMIAQRVTLDEQRLHIDVLDNALSNAQANVVKLQEECKRRQGYLEKANALESLVESLQKAIQKREIKEQQVREHLEKEIERLKIEKRNTPPDEGVSGLEDNESTSLADLIREKDATILRLEAEVSKWEQKYLEECTLRQSLEIPRVSPDLHIRETAEGSSDRSNLSNDHSNPHRMTDMDANLNKLKAQLDQKEVLIQILRQQIQERDSSLSSTSSRPTSISPNSSVQNIRRNSSDSLNNRTSPGNSVTSLHNITQRSPHSSNQNISRSPVVSMQNLSLMSLSPVGSQQNLILAAHCCPDGFTRKNTRLGGIRGIFLPLICNNIRSLTGCNCMICLEIRLSGSESDLSKERTALDEKLRQLDQEIEERVCSGLSSYIKAPLFLFSTGQNIGKDVDVLMTLGETQFSVSTPCQYYYHLERKEVSKLRNRPTGYESVTLIVALRYTVGYIVNVNRNYPFSPIGTLA
ncbi:putative angiomotin [Apostichopus japonicus]|uniref:Putative angiomotin n=1 Tax=Stichopus japonicus TaxID=307972 RepID=A0A2G8L3E2_STIJA|nr:putative angiomotin [Apostichopus japonicus]